MEIRPGIHLGYCTNIHRGETWAETFSALDRHTMEVRERVTEPGEPYGIGLRLSARAAEELAGDSAALNDFRFWLDTNNCYLYTINGFPYGTFHGSRVKEQVYLPDWSSPDRLAYTNRLFELLIGLAPEGMPLSVSTLPGSFKEFIAAEPERRPEILKNLRACSDHLDHLGDRFGRDLHLGLEPEPLGYFETTPETVAFFGRLLDGESGSRQERILQNIGVNYDTCHLALEYEEPGEALGRLVDAGIRLSKIHLSSALRATPTASARHRLASFADDVYLHQVIVRQGESVVRRFKDLPEALQWADTAPDPGEEWRVHFHIPLHADPAEPDFGDTRDHIHGTWRFLENHPGLCSHFEMETYTWEVLPESLRSGSVVDQLVREYEWCRREWP